MSKAALINSKKWIKDNLAIYVEYNSNIFYLHNEKDQIPK